MNIIITVEGKVQGVFFRASTRDKAIELGLTGFVRNQEDGSVYIEAMGEQERLNEFIAWCKRGPKNARVENVKVIEANPQRFTSFEIRRK